MKEQLAKELDSYKQRKPWREETPPNLAVEPDDDDADESAQDATDKPGNDTSSTADDAAPAESSLDKADVPRKPARR